VQRSPALSLGHIEIRKPRVLIVGLPADAIRLSTFPVQPLLCAQPKAEAMTMPQTEAVGHEELDQLIQLFQKLREDYQPQGSPKTGQ
jgi:hypothetical protein